MPMRDLLNQPVGGYEQSSYFEDVSQYNQGAPKSSMTWGQLLGVIGSLNGQGSQGGNPMNNPFAQMNQGFINQGFNQSNVPFMQSSFGSFGDQNSDSQDMGDLNELMDLVSVYYGGGVGG